MRVLVTGADGFIGTRVCDLLEQQGREVVAFDLPWSVLDPADIESAGHACDWCIHLAAHKYATTAEERPAEVADLNVRGTQNIVERFGSRVVLASTCKAADPMTVYGASKLIAERIVLNASGVVVRLVNVLGSSGSVVELWAQAPAGEPLAVTPCCRMWMTPDAAAELLVEAIEEPTGRYAPDAEPATRVTDLCSVLHPRREQVQVPPRRGDRPVERLVAEYETSAPWAPGVIRIEHPADVPAAVLPLERAA